MTSHAKSSIFRHDVSRGLLRTHGVSILDDELYSPIFCIPFGMEDKTSIHPLTQRALWAITNVMTMNQRGDNNSYIDNIPGLKCLKSSDIKEKWVIVKDNGDAFSSVRKRVLSQGVGDDGRSGAVSPCSTLDDLENFVNSRNMEDLADSDVNMPLREMNVSIRIHEVKGLKKNTIIEQVIPIGGDRGSSESLSQCSHSSSVCEMVSENFVEEDVSEFYLFLIVQCPLSFSFRKAVLESLQVKGKGNDSHVDMRRHVWSALATHVREGLLTSRDTMGNLLYSEETVAMALHVMDIDWFRVSNENSFTCLFSVHNALDWIRSHFFSKHIGVSDMKIEGFGIFNDHDRVLTVGTVSRYVQFDNDVDTAFVTNIQYQSQLKQQKRKKSTNKKNKIGNNRNEGFLNGVNMLMESQCETDEAQSVDVEKPTVVISAPRGVSFTYVDENHGVVRCNGYPSCRISMHVQLPVGLENMISLERFRSYIKSFPASVVLDILKETMSLEPDLLISQRLQSSMSSVDVSAGSENISLREGDEILSLEACRAIVCGYDTSMNRPMLAGGDNYFAKHCFSSLMSIEQDASRQRLKMLRNFIRLGFGLSLTRAMGSDNYVNERVASYGKFIELSSGSLSKKECVLTRVLFDDWRGSTVDSDMCHAAMRYVGYVLERANMRWNLKPDNLFYMVQLLVSDVMLSLNYHGSVISGACNGIGATLIIRDGGGNYRKWFRDSTTSENSCGLGQVYSKKYGSGADMVINIYKEFVDVSRYVEVCKVSEPYISELKRSTELGLMNDSCNVFESYGKEKQQVHVVTDTMARRYSTELKAGNDAQSQSCMQAIAWLIPRNTTSFDANVFKTTREHEKTKARVYVEYLQVTFGYWVICSNMIGLQSRERFRAITAVSRNIASASNSLQNPDDTNNALIGLVGCKTSIDPERLRRVNGVPDQSSSSERCVSEEHGTADVEARTLFLSGVCTAMLTSFMQWTGSLGQVSSCWVSEALMSVFYAQLELSKDILNPDMFNAGEKARCYQISKARGVAASMLFVSMEEVLEAGRCTQETHQDAIERCALRLSLESVSPSVVPWVMSDTLEHMFRLDFLVLMQMLCLKFQVPTSNFCIDDFLLWLHTGKLDHCAVLKQWFELHKRKMIKSSGADHRNMHNGMTRLEYCMYLTHDSGLTCSIHEISSDIDSTVVNAVGSALFRQYYRVLSDYCQIDEAHGGEEIVRAMLFSTVNKQFTWPTVFGNSETLKHFWMGCSPSGDQINFASTLTLTPVRIVITDVRKASLCVDLRWLLLMGCLGGVNPSQSSRFSVIGRWIQYFYIQCVPRYMRTSKKLCTSLPSPFRNSGFVEPCVCIDSESEMDSIPYILSQGEVCMLKRPSLQMCLNERFPIIGINAPINSGLVEDMGPALLRYELAKKLHVNERTLPTSCVSSYAIPYDIWIPVLLQPVDGYNDCESETFIFASLKVDNSRGGHFILKLEDADYDVTVGSPVSNITCRDGRTVLMRNQSGSMSEDIAKNGTFLNGRVIVEMRPLCLFFRPGVLLNVQSMSEMCVVNAYDVNHASYRVMKGSGDIIIMNPYLVEDCVVCVGETLFVRAFGLTFDTDSIDLTDISIDDLWFLEGVKNSGLSVDFRRKRGRDIDTSNSWIRCQLSIPREDLQTAYVRNNVFSGNGFVSVVIDVHNFSQDLFRSHATMYSHQSDSRASKLLVNVHVKDIISDTAVDVDHAFFAIGFR